MSVIYCHGCDHYIDTDFDAEHESECNEPEQINDLGGEVEFGEVF